MKRSVLAAGIVAALFAVSTASAAEVKIATGHTFIKKIFDPVRTPFREKTGIDINVLFNDPVPALALLEKGGADAAGASLTLEDWLEAARKGGAQVKEKSAYTTFVPVTEKTHVMVHASNKVKELSREQLKGVFTGRIANWKEVGGDDAPILVVWPSVTSGALILFKNKVMDNEAVAKGVYDVQSVGDIPDAVAVTPEAIGIVTGGIGDKPLKDIAPPLERPLTLVYKGTPSPELQKLLDFLKGEGKQYMK